MNSSLRNGIAAIALTSVASMATAGNKFEPENINLYQTDITKYCQNTNIKIGAILAQK